MLTIKRLIDCPLADAVQAWNKGFEDYMIPLAFPTDFFVARMGMEGLSATHSVIAYMDGEPAGLIMNGIRVVGGKKIGWNGGTAVVPDYRKNGVGSAMMEESLRIYKEEGAELATLEAIFGNDKAIRVYERLGYTEVDRLVYLELAGGRVEAATAVEGLSLRVGKPQEAAKLPFYRHDAAWQTQWQSVRDGEAVFLEQGGRVVGYCFFKRGYDAEANHTASTVFQSVVEDAYQGDRKDAIRLMLSQAFQSEHDIHMRAFHMSAAKDGEAMEVMQQMGLQYVRELLNMTKPLVGA